MYSFVLHIPGFRPSLLLNDCVCAEKDDLPGPRAHWQKTAVCPSSRSALRCPGTLPARRSGPQRGGTIWYQLPSGRGASVLPSLLSVKVTAASWTRAVPGWLAGWHKQELPIMPQWWRARWPWDRPGSSPSLCCRLLMRGWMEAHFVQLVTVQNVMHEWNSLWCVSTCLYCGEVDWAHSKIVSVLEMLLISNTPITVHAVGMHSHRSKALPGRHYAVELKETTPSASGFV